MLWTYPSRVATLAFLLSACISLGDAQSAYDFHQTLTVAPSEVVVLNVALARGDLEIFYSRDGQVSLTASGHDSTGARLDAEALQSTLAIEQNGNRLTFRQPAIVADLLERGVVRYRIDVPYRTQVTSTVERGSQSFSGILGPVAAKSIQGDIKASYVSRGFEAQVERGNIDLDVIGEKANATTNAGNISATRLPQGIHAVSGDGDITLTEVGASAAQVTTRSGRIEVRGAQSSLEISTQTGDLHIKAEPHADWRLCSVSGTIRIELPQSLKASLDASTESGVLQLDRNDLNQEGQYHDALDQQHSEGRRLAQEISGGGPQIHAHSDTGKILIR